MFLEELANELKQLKDNKFNEFTDYDHGTVQFSVSKMDEAVQCLHDAHLNMKTLLR